MAATLEELKHELSELDVKMTEILETAKTESGGKLSEEKRKEFDELESQFLAKEKEYDELQKDIERAEAQQKRRKKIKNLNPGRQTQPDKIDAKVVVEGFEKDPNAGFSDHREMLLAVMDASSAGKVTDKRLQYLAVGSDEQSTVSDPYGGFLLPVGFTPDLLSIGAEADPTAQYTTRIPMTTQTVEIPARVDKNHTSSVSGGLQVYRRNETDTSSSTRMEIEQVKLTATMLFGLAYATEELLQRSPISFIALLEAGFSDEFAAKILKEKLFGTGAGEYEGITNSPAAVDQAKETGQAASTIVKENIDKMRSRCWGYSNAIWLYNHDCLPQLRSLVQNVGTGGQPVSYFTVDNDGMSRLDGRPAFATEFTQTLGTSGDLILCNWSQYLEGTLTPQNQAESVHVRFVNHERTFKFWMENDGRCWWRSALTPNQSSTTLSPIVTLATRA